VEREETREVDLRQRANTGTVVSTYPRVAAVRQLVTTNHDPFQARRQTAYKLVQGIYLLFGSIDALITIRVLLRVLGANPSASFAQWIYGMTDRLAAPFAGLFSPVRVASSVLEPNALVALAIYALLGWQLGKMTWLVIGETRTALMANRRCVRTRVD
jgi:NAD-dependent oxidoreductase involved in siderophore biosynthesis